MIIAKGSRISMIHDSTLTRYFMFQTCPADYGWQESVSVDSRSPHGSKKRSTCGRRPSFPRGQGHDRNAGELPRVVRRKPRKGELQIVARKYTPEVYVGLFKWGNYDLNLASFTID